MSTPPSSPGPSLTIGLDLRYITTGASGGVAPQITETFRALIASCPDWRFHVFGTMFNQDLIPAGSPNVVHDTLPLDGFYAAEQDLLDTHGVDVLYRPFPNEDDLAFPLERQIVFIPDLQHEFFPDFFDAETLSLRRTHFARLITGAGAVATNSDHARGTIRDRYRNAHDDIFLMPPGSALAPTDGSPVPEAFADRVASLTPYFFFPANIWRHKNHAALLEAFHRFRRESPQGPATSLVLSGHPKGWDALRASHPADGVHHLGFVSRAELLHLYRNALALAFPSLFEGFGMPVLEAFATDCAVICSDTSSLPEVAGGAALTCDPADPASIAAAMARLAGDPSLRAALVEKGRERVRAYSWAASAAALKEAMIRVAARKVEIRPRAPGAGRPAIADTSVKVSIVTPSYNQGRFLERTIESVLGQTYPNIEYVVMDGGSSDESVAILKSYGDRFRWVSEKDGGQTDAINKGLRRCSGQILAYLNSDDTLEPDAVERVVAFFHEHPEIDLVYGDANYIDADDAVTGRYLTAPYSWDRLVQDCCVCQPAAFWRSSVTERFGLFDDTLDFTMDYEYWLRIGRGGGGIMHLPVLLANSRLYPETKTLSFRAKIYGEIFAISQKHAGRVSRSYVQGYWNHRLWEREDPFARVARRIPMLEKVFVEYDAARLDEPHYPPFKALRHVAYRSGRSIRARIVNAIKRSSFLVPLASGVAGVYKDNWLAPYVRLSASPARDRPLVLEGRVPKDMILRVRAGRDIVGEFPLQADRLERVELHGSAGPMEFRFSAYVPDKAGRHLAFHVTSTNCFAEDEI